MTVEMIPGKGPSFPEPLVTPDDLAVCSPPPRFPTANVPASLTPHPPSPPQKLPEQVDVHKELGYVFEALALTRRELQGRCPIYGFCGGPWTLMAYMVEGGGSPNYAKAKAWLYAHPEASKKLLEKITDVSIDYLVGQVLSGGAQLLQVFESSTGELAQTEFREFCLPYITRIASTVKARLRAAGAAEPLPPMVIFARGAHYALEDLATLDYDVIQIDWTMDRKQARQRVGPSKTLQGNLDPCALFGDDESIRRRAKQMVEGWFGRHIQ